MIDTVELPAPAAPAAEPPGMLLHCGGEAVTRDALFATPTPDPTDTWFPLAHRDLVTEVEDQLTGAGFEIASSVHALSHHGGRYFGVIQVRLPDQEVTDYAWIVGLRNSHDKSYPAGLVRIIRKATCRNPDDRYPCLDDLLEDLRNYRQHKGVGMLHADVEDRNTGILSVVPDAPARPEPSESPAEARSEPPPKTDIAPDPIKLKNRFRVIALALSLAGIASA